jgi:peroxiredoxin
MPKSMALGAVLLITLFSSAAFSQQALRIGSPVPQFSATSSDGVQYDLAAMRGKVVVLTFWSTRCEICRVELPRLSQSVAQYDPAHVVFLALSPESDEIVRPYLKNHAFRFKTVSNSFGTLLQYADRDRSGSLMMQYPAFYVIGRDGRLSYRGSGYGHTDQLDNAVKQAVAAR